MEPNHKFRYLRMKHGYTQKEAAQLLGVTRQYVSEIECRASIPGRKLAIRMQEVTEEWGDKIAAMDWWEE